MRKELDRDALFTLTLSNLLILASGALSFLLLLRRVLRTGTGAPTSAPAGSLVLVFGHRLKRDGGLSADYRQRLDRAAACLRQDSQSRLLLLGGVTRPDTPSEAAAGKEYLEQLGIAKERIDTEDHSQHTLDNLRKAVPLLAGQKQPIALLSNRYHLARALRLAETMGLAAQPCAAEQPALPGPRALVQYLRETYFLHWYLTGLRWALLAGNERMLARLR